MVEEIRNINGQDCKPYRAMIDKLYSATTVWAKNEEEAKPLLEENLKDCPDWYEMWEANHKKIEEGYPPNATDVRDLKPPGQNW